MANQICHNCDRTLREQDEVIAEVVARYHELGSKTVYCITKPTECLNIIHKNCQHPKGEYEGD